MSGNGYNSADSISGANGSFWPTAAKAEGRTQPKADAASSVVTVDA
jgi:hypothetical protein